MSFYDFSTLNDKDFEDIVCDLLSSELNIPFQSFKEGKDKGIDLRYSTKDNENEIVVQVKHYLKTGKSGLKTKLKTTELKSIKSLNPKRYIIATSIDLGPADKEKIKADLTPYIKSTQDIYGKNELNSALTRHKNIEKKHFKLWLTNTNILNRIIQNGVLGRSEFIESKIRRNIGLFVKNRSFDDALEILKAEKILLITGTPGIGKTTLSYILSYYFLAKEFELIYSNDFQEAESVFGQPKDKQIFFFDDFLGDSYLEIINGKNKAISDFIERVKTSKNKFIILTTRTTILNQAKSLHEKIDRISFKSKNIELKIENYNLLDKANILYNHLYINNIPSKFINELLIEKNYLRIINHGNYNPRLLEFITNTDHFNEESESYLDFCINNLDNPKKVWEKPFWNQLNDNERNVLFCLLSIGRSASLHDLELIYESKCDYDRFNYNRIFETNSFKTVFENLLNGFIKASKNFNNINIEFINPSLKDYLINYFNSNKFEKKRFFQSFNYIDQYNSIFKSYPSGNSEELIFDIDDLKFAITFISDKKVYSLSTKNHNSIYLQNIFFLNNHYLEFYLKGITNEVIDLQLSLLRKIDWHKLDISLNFNYEIIKMLNHAELEHPLGLFFTEAFPELIYIILPHTNEEIELESIFELQEKYNLNIFNSLEENNDLEILKDCIRRVFVRKSDELFDDLSNEIIEEDNFNSAVNKVDDLIQDLSSQYYKNYELNFEYNPFNEVGFQRIFDANIESQFDPINEWKDSKNEIQNSNFDSEIENLFNRFKSEI